MALSGTREDGVIEVFGEGTLVEYTEPIGAVGVLAEMAIAAGLTNPKIQLDSGEVVFGCECWWGSPEKVRASLGDRPTVEVTVAQKRREFLEGSK